MDMAVMDRVTTATGATSLRWQWHADFDMGDKGAW